MTKKGKAVLSLDTSNYTTSLAAVGEEDNIILDKRIPLLVKQGERGLRQSYALFQHMENIPVLVKEAMKKIDPACIGGISVSNRPRPLSGSYMPVFKAGIAFGTVLSSALAVPYFEFSHQEGHIAAAAYGTSIDLCSNCLAFHLSGGTCELLFLDYHKGIIERIGGTRDISLGQLIDRTGVLMGLDFPSGRQMDKLALHYKGERISFPPIPTEDLFINLSGIETQISRMIAKGKIDSERIAYSLFSEIADCLIKWTSQAGRRSGCTKVLFTGGVAASSFLRARILNHYSKKDLEMIFGDPRLSTDNAVGIAILGRRALQSIL